MDRNKVRAIFILGILVSILVACGGKPVGNLSPLTPTVWSESPFTDTPSITPTMTKFSMPSATQTLIPLGVYTERARQSTAIVIATMDRAAVEQAWDEKRTQIDQFSVGCNELEFYLTEISPDGNWIAASCGYKRDQTLIVKSKQGVSWVVEYKELISPNQTGALFPVFWDVEGGYLYFSGSKGSSSGGNQCFPVNLYRDSSYGLFQLNLNQGSWVILLPPTDSFYGIRFSPTGRRYAVDMNGITIADLKSGDLVEIDTSGVMDLLWSPDGRYLAYSVANCNESGWAQSAAVYVWDSTTNLTQEIFSIKVEKILLYPEVWIDNSTLRVSVEKPTDTHPLYDIYDIDIVSGSFVLWGTATPSP